MKIFTKTALAACTLILSSQAMAQLVLYEGEGFRGRSVVVDRDMRNLDRRGLGDKANSIVVERGRWEVCEQPRSAKPVKDAGMTTSRKLQPATTTDTAAGPTNGRPKCR